MPKLDRLMVIFMHFLLRVYLSLIVAGITCMKLLFFSVEADDDEVAVVDDDKVVVVDDEKVVVLDDEQVVFV